jgi:hypothetical protein
MFQNMEVTEIKEVGRLLKLHRLVDELTERIEKQLPTREAVKDGVYRAFRNPHSNTEYMVFIRREAKLFLREKGYAVEATA